MKEEDLESAGPRLITSRTCRLPETSFSTGLQICWSILCCRAISSNKAHLETGGFHLALQTRDASPVSRGSISPRIETSKMSYSHTHPLLQWKYKMPLENSCSQAHRLNPKIRTNSTESLSWIWVISHGRQNSKMTTNDPDPCMISGQHSCDYVTSCDKGKEVFRCHWGP